MLNILVTNINSSEQSKYYFGLVCTIAISIGLFLSIIQPGYLLTDGGIFSAIALKDLNDGALYLDAWENKPPAIFFLIELFFIIIPHYVYALFILSFLAIISIGICLYYLIYTYINSFFTSLFITCIALYFTIKENTIGDGLYTEIYGTLCILLSMVFMEMYSYNKKLKLSLVSALFLGLAPWFKEPFFILCLPLLVLYSKTLLEKKRRIYFLLSALIPAVCFTILLLLKGSFGSFIDMILYNFQYLNSEENTGFTLKINNYYTVLISPLLALSLLVCLMVYKTIIDIRTRHNTILYLILFAISVYFVLVSPYNFGHYYFPSFALFFIVISKIYQNYTLISGQNFKIPLILILLYSMYKIDNIEKPKFKYQIEVYKPDKISSYLKNKKEKTLFVEYVAASEYYVKSGLIYPTYLPVGLPVHFLENQSGIQNRNKIEKELTTNRPDYIISTYTPSYFTWKFSKPLYNEELYEKIDSIHESDKNVIYLWELRENRP